MVFTNLEYSWRNLLPAEYIRFCGIISIFLPLSFISIQDQFLKKIDDFRMIIGNVSNEILVFKTFEKNTPRSMLINFIECVLGSKFY